jgi:hypothetical protein
MANKMSKAISKRDGFMVPSILKLSGFDLTTRAGADQ